MAEMCHVYQLLYIASHEHHRVKPIRDEIIALKCCTWVSEKFSQSFNLSITCGTICMGSSSGRWPTHMAGLIGINCHVYWTEHCLR